MRWFALFLCACTSSSPPPGSVEGRVLYGAAPLAGALVRLSGQALGAVTASDGTYVFPNIAAGTYTVSATSEAWSVEGAVSMGVTVAKSAEKVADLTLTPAGDLSGTLTQATIEDLTGAVVTLLPVGTTAFADASGAFDFGRVAAGSYTISAVGNGRVTASNQAVSVAAQQATEVTIVLLTQEAPPVHVNHPPVVSGITMIPIAVAAANPALLIIVPDLPADDVASGGQAHFVCAASDPDGDPLSIAWQVSGGLAEASGDGIDWTASGDSATVGCIVSDGQGGVASASRAISVFDFNYIGAALAGSQLVVARSNATNGSNDLFVQDLTNGAVSQIATSANESKPQLSASALVYLSDENATAENPLDVYRRAPPAAAETRLSNGNGAEVFSLNGNDVWIANGNTLTHVDASGNATLVLPNPGATLASADVIDQLSAGNASVFLHETDGTDSAWLGFRVSDGEVFALTISADAAVAFDGNAFFVADPDAQEIFSLADAVPVSGQTQIGALPLLSGTPIASIVAASGENAASVFDNTGLFGDVIFGGMENFSPTGPAYVLGVAGKNVLFGTPASQEVPPTKALYLWAAP